MFAVALLGVLGVFFVHWGVPGEDSGGAFHAVELAFGAVRVAAHSAKAEPVSDTDVLGQADVLGNDVHAVAGHSEKRALREGVLANVELLLCVVVHLLVKLVRLVLERHSVHQNAVERVVQRVVQVVAQSPLLRPLRQHSRKQVASVLRKVTPRLRYYSVSQRIVFGDFQSVNDSLAQFSRRISTS